MQFTEFVAPTPHGGLAGVQAGSHAPVVCLHGISAHARVFDPLAAMLAPSYLVASVDQRGHGRTGPMRGGYGKAACADDVAAVVDHLQAGPAIVVGHSLGARNAIVAASRHPHHVRAIVAVEFVPAVERSVLDRLKARVTAGTGPFASWDDARAALTRRYPLLPAEAIERRLRYGFHADDDGEIRAVADPAALEATADGLYDDIADEFADFPQPGIVVRGSQSAFVSPDAFAAAQRERPGLRYELVSGADHYVPELRADAIADLVRALDG